MSAEQGLVTHSNCPGYSPFHTHRFKTSLELFEAKVRKSVEECTLSALAAEGSGSEGLIQLCEGRWSQAMRVAMETAVAEKQVCVHTGYPIGAVGRPLLVPPPTLAGSGRML